MHDAATITLIILTVALLRRSLLSPDAAPGIRDEVGKPGITAPARVVVEADRPLSARRGRARK
jgi:hypothetical protein